MKKALPYPTPEQAPALFRCGEPPKDGDYVWRGDTMYMVSGMLLIPVDINATRPTLGERITRRLFCPACFLPKLVPGHKFRGCSWR